MSDEFLTSETSPADVALGMQPQPALDPAVSLTEYAMSSTRTPEPVGRTLRAIAERSFTGEVEFALGTGVLVYADGGHPYYAERVGDAPLGERLVTMGVVKDEQLARGIIRVGDVEHLGRLFDRDATIDRDAVLAATELITDELLTEIARDSAAVSLTSYRHHRSGVHRWFVGPGRTAPVRPVDSVRQIDASVFDQLPDVSGSASTRSLPAPAEPSTQRSQMPAPQPAEPEMRIEWDQPGPPDADELPAPHDAAGADIDIDEELRSFDADEADWSASAAPPAPVPSRPLLTPPTASPPVTPPPPLVADEVVSDSGSPAPSEPASTPDEVQRVPGVAPNPEPIASRAEPLPDTRSATPPTSDVDFPDVGSLSATTIDPGATAARDAVAAATTTPAVDPVADGFTIVWPDGSEEPTDTSDHATTPVASIAPSPAAESDEPVDAEASTDSDVTLEPLVLDAVEEPVVRLDVPVMDEIETAPLADEGVDVAALAVDARGISPVDPVSVVPAADALPEFSLPALEVESIPEPDAEVPDDVADAVRRALAAIERASVTPDSTSRLRVAPVELPDFAMPKLLDRSAVEPEVASTPSSEPTPMHAPIVESSDQAVNAPETSPPVSSEPAPVADVPMPTTAAPAGFGFAPPTADMTAEAVYARAAEAAPAEASEAVVADDLPEPGQASVVFVDAEVETDERKGALKRLIGSLRRK